MARSRYGWEKRSKELARKRKAEEKLKRRQGKAQAGAGGAVSGTGAAENLEATAAPASGEEETSGQIIPEETP